MDEKINWTTFGLIALVLFIIYTVNPYVVGSSPTARARFSADFCGFFVFSRC